MATVTLGRTGLTVQQNGFGALPVQRTPLPGAVQVLRAAREAGITFFDTARGYTDSEEKLGAAFGDGWDGLVLATKTPSTTVEGFWQDLDTSLKNLRRPYVDIYQFHNPAVLPLPGDGTGLYEAMLQAREKGLIRHIGVTNHRLPVARQAAESGLYATLQFPFSYLSGEKDLELVALCKANNVGFIAMKALSGGLLTDISAAVAFMAQHGSVVPIWGIENMDEVQKLAAAMAETGGLTAAHAARIEKDKAELQGEFCRGCGYCLPCPQGIRVNFAARIITFMDRSPGNFLAGEWPAEMAKVPGCTECGQCASRCPYELDPPAMIRKNYAEYSRRLKAAGGA